MVLMSRRAEFSAAHFYHNPDWTPAENQRVFGKCSNLQGHGHNYVAEITVSGEVDQQTGFVMDLQKLKQIMQDEILVPFDHRHLNKEVPEFASLVPTTENLAIVIWNRLQRGWNDPARLYRVRIYETPDLFADVYGEE